MSSKLNKLIEAQAPKFEGWIDALNNHHQSIFDSKKYSTEEYSNLIFATSDVLHKISEIFIKYGAFKDSFDNSKMHVHIYGPELIIKSEKTGGDFRLGVDNEGIYLESFLRFAENMRHMGDDFYKNFLSLDNFGEFELKENQFYNFDVTARYESLYQNRKSKLFKLLRNYMVGMAEEQEDILLGQMTVKWPPDMYFSDIIKNGCQAFKVMYKLNYSLWKISDLKKK